MMAALYPATRICVSLSSEHGPCTAGDGVGAMDSVEFELPLSHDPAAPSARMLLIMEGKKMIMP